MKRRLARGTEQIYLADLSPYVLIYYDAHSYQRWMLLYGGHTPHYTF
jgi:hypothetical protein